MTAAYTEADAHFDAMQDAADDAADIAAEEGHVCKGPNRGYPGVGYFPVVDTDGYDADGWLVR